MKMRLLPLLLAGFLLLGGCGLLQPDAVGYVDGLLRHNYFHEITEEYLGMVLISREQAEEDYTAGLHNDVENFFSYFGLSHSHELDEEIAAFYAKVNANASFTVAPKARKVDYGFEVDVTVSPILLFDGLTAQDYDEALTEVWETYYDYLTGAKETDDAVIAAYDADFTHAMLALLETRLDTLTYGEPQLVTLRIQKDNSGYYQLNQEDFQALDRLVIHYGEETQEPPIDPAGDLENTLESTPGAAPEGDPESPAAPEGDPESPAAPEGDPEAAPDDDSESPAAQ